jgi:hypothetical protein
MSFIGRVYKITSPQTEKVYVGSTKKTIEARFGDHKSDYKTRGDKINIGSFDILKFDDAKVELLEEREFNNTKELYLLERFYMEQFENTTNKLRPIVSNDDVVEYQKKYHEANKERIKKLNIENKDKIKISRRKYYDANINKIKEYQKEVLVCKCGCNITRKAMKNHERTKRHIKQINNITININNSDVVINK